MGAKFITNNRNYQCCQSFLRNRAYNFSSESTQAGSLEHSHSLLVFLCIQLALKVDRSITLSAPAQYPISPKLMLVQLESYPSEPMHDGPSNHGGKRRGSVADGQAALNLPPGTGSPTADRPLEPPSAHAQVQ